jgi:hypothetical protein
MSALTKEQVIQVGGKVWSKDGQELRVYLNKDAVLKLVEGFQVTALEANALVKAKTFFDIATGELKSDVGTVRSLLNGAGIACGK